MNLREMLDAKMPSNLSALEKTRFYYIELGKYVSFSTTYQNTDIGTMARMHTDEVDVTNFNSTQVNCVIWASLYSQLLTGIGVKNKIIKQGHDYVEFYIDGVRWCADATYGEYTDLARIHNDDATCHFGIARYQENSRVNTVRMDDEAEKTIRDIDEKLGYNTEERQKVLRLKDFLKKIYSGEFKAQDFIFDNEIIQDELVFIIELLFAKLGVLKYGYYEAKDFIKELMGLMLTSQQLARVKGVELKRTNSAKEVDIVQCISVQGKDKLHYYLLAPNLPIQFVSEDEIVKLAMLGYGIDKKEIPGIIFPRNFKPGEISCGFKYKIQRHFIGDKLIVYDEVQQAARKR